MTPLRQQFLDAMRVRHYAESTQKSYVNWVIAPGQDRERFLTFKILS